jgi:hypothetical protein
MMNGNPARNWWEPDPLPSHDWKSLAIAVLIGAFLGTVVATVTERQLLHPASALETAPVAVEFPAREIPREWRGARKAIAFEHMFREGS